MEGYEIIQAAIGVLAFTGNALAAIMFFFAKKAFSEIDKVKEEADELRYNYMNRFDDVKDAMNKIHLDIIQKIAKLELTVKRNQQLK